jgi:hypothetical protein
MGNSETWQSDQKVRRVGVEVSAVRDQSIYPEKLTEAGESKLWIEGRLTQTCRYTAKRSDEVLAELIKLRDSGTEALSGLESLSQFAKYWYREVYMQREVKHRA